MIKRARILDANLAVYDALNTSPFKLVSIVMTDHFPRYPVDSRWIVRGRTKGSDIVEM